MFLDFLLGVCHSLQDAQAFPSTTQEWSDFNNAQEAASLPAAPLGNETPCSDSKPPTQVPQEWPAPMPETHCQAPPTQVPQEWPAPMPETPCQASKPSPPLTAVAPVADHMRSVGKGAAPTRGKGKGGSLAGLLTTNPEHSTGFVDSPGQPPLLVIPDYSPDSCPTPPQLPTDLSKGAIYKRMYRVFQPRADGTYLVPEEVVKEWKNLRTRPNVEKQFEKCGWSAVAWLYLLDLSKRTL